MLGIWRCGQHGVMACGMEAEQDFGLWGFLDSEPLGPDRHAAIAADFDGRADAPDVLPPRTARSWPDDGAVFFLCQVPGPLRSLAKFAMDFVGIAMGSEGVDVGIGQGDVGNLFAGKVGGQAALPELVFAFDFSLGLRRGGVTQADVVELKRPAQLGERVGIVGEEEAMVIDVELEGPTMGPEGGGQEIEVGEEQFTLVEFGTGEEAAAIIEHVEHGECDFGGWEPAVGRGVELPEFANTGPLPAAHRGQNSSGWDGVGQAILEGPAADLGAVEFE